MSYLLPLNLRSKKFHVESLKFLLLHPRNHERMVTALAQLHLDVHKFWHIPLGGLHQEAMIALEDGPIVLLLYCREFDVDDRLLLGRNVFRYVLLHSP